MFLPTDFNFEKNDLQVTLGLLYIRLTWQLVCKFGTAERYFLLIIQVLTIISFSNYFTKCCLLSHSIDVVYILSYKKDLMGYSWISDTNFGWEYRHSFSRIMYGTWSLINTSVKAKETWFGLVGKLRYPYVCVCVCVCASCIMPSFEFSSVHVLESNVNNITTSTSNDNDDDKYQGEQCDGYGDGGGDDDCDNEESCVRDGNVVRLNMWHLIFGRKFVLVHWEISCQNNFKGTSTISD